MTFKPDTTKLSFTCKLDWKLLYLKCIALTKILLWNSIFAGLLLHENIMRILVI